MRLQNLALGALVAICGVGAIACSSAQDADTAAAGGDIYVGGAGPSSQGVGGAGAQSNSSSGGVLCDEALPYASDVVAFVAGPNAGYGEDEPEVVLGPPRDGSPSMGSLHVLSLGVGGEIILSFGERVIYDGPGTDFVVWENPFWVGGNEQLPYVEWGEVAVSNDLESWHAYPCSPTAAAPFDAGCAGWRPMRPFDVCGMNPLDPDKTGGDGFDLSELGMSEARYVRIRDLSTSGVAPSAGFDLDAVGAVHLREP
jgi:hypothetical protein